MGKKIIFNIMPLKYISETTFILKNMKTLVFLGQLEFGTKTVFLTKLLNINL